MLFTAPHEQNSKKQTQKRDQGTNFLERFGDFSKELDSK